MEDWVDECILHECVIHTPSWFSEALCNRVSQWTLRLGGSGPGQVANFLSNSVSSSVM